MNGAQVVAKNILKKIRSCGIQHKESEADDHITVSIGGTTAIVKHLHNGSDYIKNADKALYESKKTDATDTHLKI
jgi:PleD family two-component response regulator